MVLTIFIHVCPRPAHTMDLDFGLYTLGDMGDREAALAHKRRRIPSQRYTERDELCPKLQGSKDDWGRRPRRPARAGLPL